MRPRLDRSVRGLPGASQSPRTQPHGRRSDVPPGPSARTPTGREAAAGHGVAAAAVSALGRHPAGGGLRPIAVAAATAFAATPEVHPGRLRRSREADCASLPWSRSLRLLRIRRVHLGAAYGAAGGGLRPIAVVALTTFVATRRATSGPPTAAGSYTLPPKKGNPHSTVTSSILNLPSQVGTPPTRLPQDALSRRVLTMEPELCSQGVHVGTKYTEEIHEYRRESFRICTDDTTLTRTV